MAVKKDQIVQSTDLDALSCRFSCQLKGYLNDEFMIPIVANQIRFQPLLIESEFARFAITRNLRKQFFNLFDKEGRFIGYSSAGGPGNSMKVLKSPIINRGTWLRTKSIDLLLNKFLNTFKDQEVQILSIGSGSDTRCFNYLSKEEYNLKYIEIDFDTSCRVKKYSILSNPEMSRITKTEKYTQDFSIPKTFEEFYAGTSDLKSDNYSLLGMDLREIYNNPKESLDKLKEIIDFSKPTLILSECVFCYLESYETDSIIKFFNSNLQDCTIINYDPIGGESTDEYGSIMVNNLSSRGIEMPSLIKYGTIEKQYNRLKDIISNQTGSNKSDVKIKLSDLKFINHNWFPDSEISRVSRLEFLDELEEINLINKHYLICVYQFGECFNLFNDLKFQLEN
ncbi:hypothetical protein B5S31_g2200 [[Candida] boidinii]|nr:hypothetical protein B5S29_g4194 [[Candida] boidinii]OWB72486.1 hypothetical protein B5S31_g2200 [[Candida] boidinii]OWB78451.1 hypothetical protein B5S32_g2645 [[Candida] boidinii]